MGWLCHGRIGAHAELVHSADKTPPAFGEDVALGVPAAKVQLFDRETGMRLAAADKAPALAHAY